MAPSRRVMRLAVNRRLVDGPLGTRYLSRRASMQSLLPTPESDVYVDGFPRSANSYSFYALKQSNPQARVAGHCHSADATKRALELEVPTMLLLREPLPVVASFTQFVPGLSVRSALSHYQRFHQRLSRLRDDLFVARFEDVVDDFGVVIERFNAATGASLAPYRKTEENEASLAAVLDHANDVYGQGTSTLARPSGERSRLGVSELIRTPREARLLAECERLYERLGS